MSVADLCTVLNLVNTTVWLGMDSKALERLGLISFGLQGKFRLVISNCNRQSKAESLRKREICPLQWAEPS